MSFYEERILPHVIKLACGNKTIRARRRLVVPEARGRVLEIGMGPALNLPFYDPAKVEMVWGLEPSHGMRRIARKQLATAPFEVRWLDLPGEEIPLEDASVDTVLLTFTLCTIPDWRRALEQMRRVLKPGGTLLFCEHGASPDPSVRRCQDRVNPLWRKVAGGCNLNREIPGLIEQAGFRIRTLQAEYMPHTPRIAGYNYWGSATAD